MECGHCRTDNPISFRHCGACGQRLAATPCDSCGFSTQAPFTFCGGCGLTLDLHRGSSPEERRFATVVFADVVGFTKLADDTDPEDTARIIDVAFRQLSEVVTDHGGTIDKYIGDSLMAVFGIPQAHEDDAERAVAAALAMQRADTGLGFAIGVNTGEVMVTALGGGANTVMGDTVNVAARLEKVAKEGEVLVGPITYELTASKVSYRDRPPLTLKGKREPVELHQAISMRMEPTPNEIPQVPMVGRVEELDFLFSQWRRACSLKRLATVLLTGDAGIGKTRLLDELVARIGDEALIARSSYPPYGGAGGMRVGGDLLEQLGPGDDEAVQRRVRSLTGDIDESLRDMDPVALRKEQVWALRRLAEGRCKEKPVIVIIEDVHMASTSIELLTGFIAQVIDLPMMVILAGRPEGRWQTSFPMASTVRLRSLSLDGSRRLAQLWSPGEAPDEALLAWAAGNPLFLRELLAFTQLHGHDSVDRQQFPVSLRAVLAARLDTLASAERAALQDFAVIGDTATVEQLVALGGPGASDGISGLTNSGVVRHRPDGTLRITEPLLREVAYETMPRTMRVERHSRMAELATTLQERARHLSKASEHAVDDAHLRDDAAAALAAAGLDALENSRRPEGIGSLQRAVEMGYRDPATILKLASALNDSDRHEALRLIDLVPVSNTDKRLDAERTHTLANALMEVDPPSALAAFDRAVTQWHNLGDHTKEAWAHSNKGVALFMNGQIIEADDSLVRATELFKAENDRTGELATMSFRSLVRPDHPDVEVWLQDSLAYAIELGDRSRHLGALSSLQWHHYLATRLGGPKETVIADAWIEEQIGLARELGWLDFAFQGLCLKANLARYDGNFVVARAALDEARELGLRDSAGERALLQAIDASLDPGRPLRVYEGSDPFTNLAAVIQLETAFLEGRCDEIRELNLVPTERRINRSDTSVGLVVAAAGLVTIGEYELAESFADDAIVASMSSKRTLQRIAAEAVRAESLIRRGRPAKLSTPVGQLGGLAGILVARAWVAQGNDEATMVLAEFASRLRAPGISAGIAADAVVPG
jgi:class 3 adenylate cyclase/tetratricopeptide (TPR) repeat protein